MKISQSAARNLLDQRPVTTKGSLLDLPSGPVAIGIDASLTSFGLSAVSPEDHYTMRFQPKLRGVMRVDEIYEFVYDTVASLNALLDVRHIVMEDYAPGVQGRRHAIGEGGGATKLALLHCFSEDRLGFPTLVSPTALKKFVTGKGTAKKNEMLLAVYRKWGIEFSNDDMCDAFALGRLGLAILSGQTETAYEAAVLTALETHTEWVP